jgi:TatA/E family protein of Tat protein translocase
MTKRLRMSVELMRHVQDNGQTKTNRYKPVAEYGKKMMDGFHWTDMLALLALGLLIFGPKRLPELGRSVGSALREFRRALSDMGSGAPSQVNTITDSVPTAPEETQTSAPAEPSETGKQGESQQQETGPP